VLTSKYVIIALVDGQVLDLAICEEEDSKAIDTNESKTWAAYWVLRKRHSQVPADNFSVFRLRKKPECKNASKNDPLPPGSYMI